MLALLPFLPLAAALGLLICSWRKVLIALAPWTALPSLIFAVAGWGREVDIQWMLLNSKMGLDLTGRVFLGFTSLIWLISGVYAQSYIRKNKNVFFAFFLLALSGNLGLIISYDVVSFYFFFALMSFSAYVLVIFSETKSAFYAGRVYIALVLLGEILVFTALAISAYAGGSLYFSDITKQISLSPYLPYMLGTALFGFGIKAGLLPLHVWLPLAHPVAPTPASAVLSACMIKAGVLGWLRLFPLGEISLPLRGGIIIFLGLFGAYYAALTGIPQKNVKTVLAYSSISQIGIITFLVGVGLQYPELWPQVQKVLFIYIVAHALMKSALFLTAGIDIRSSKFCMLAAIVPALAMAGAPWTAGGVAKALIKGEVLPLIEASYLKYWLEGTSYMTAFLMFRYLYLLFTTERGGKQYGAWWAMIGIVFLVPFFLLDDFPVSDLFTLKQIIPLLTAAIVGIFFVNYPSNISVPKGDLLVVYEWGVSPFIAVFQKIGSLANHLKTYAIRSLTSIHWPTGSKLIAMENALMQFPVFGVLLVGLTILFYFLQ